MATAGPNTAGTGADDSSTGNTAWANPGNITADDSSYATVTVSNVALSHYLKATNFGFSIPTGSTINGIMFTVKWKSNNAQGFTTSAKALKAGTPTSSDLAGGETPPVTEATQDYGSASQKWGTTWTAANINDSTFGFIIAGADGAGGNTVSVNSITCTVTYTPPSTPGSLQVRQAVKRAAFF